MISCEIVVTGKVQGVGFRRFVLDLSHQFNISGFVKNKFPYDVYIIASGEEFSINMFLSKLKQGNLFSRVESVTCNRIPLEDDFPGFTIK